jgi:hypothetical protein
MDTIEARLAAVQARIAKACALVGRKPEDITLLAVSKTRPREEVLTAYAAGQRAFGENQLQDAQLKLDATSELHAQWHFIGPLQSNKSRPVAEQFDWVHSVDRVKIATRLGQQRPETAKPLQICLQYNVSGEASKSGFQAGELAQAADTIAELTGLRLRGLMAIPAPSGVIDEQRRAFASVRDAFEQLVEAGHALDTLSMGMTDDMEAAIAEGATIVRIGTAIFGPRNPRPGA